MAYSSSGSSRGGEGPAGGTGTSYGRYHHNEAVFRYGGDGDRMGALLGFASDPSAGAAGYGISSLAYHQQQQQQQMEHSFSAGFGSDLSHLESSIAMGLKRPIDNVFQSVDELSKRSRVENVYNLPVYPQRPGEKDCVFYMKTRSCKFGISCRFDHPTWVPAGGIPDWKEAVPSKTESLPLRPGEPDCVFYMKYGSCKFGETCKFNHPNDRLALKTDTEALSEQNRTEEDTTRGEREEDVILKPANAFNSKGFPIRPGETDCTFYMQMGSCKYGSTCRFNHPEIAVGLSSPGVTGGNAFGGLMGSLGAWPGGVTIGQQYLGYTPDFGLLGLNTAAFGGLLNLPSYPQRPGEQECSFYMKTGVCKFGAGCRFHHPVNRSEASSHSESNFASSGLPRREGETVCSFYLKTGVCKYGATCKFDHPPPSEVAAKVLEDAKKAVDQKKRD